MLNNLTRASRIWPKLLDFTCTLCGVLQQAQIKRADRSGNAADRFSAIHAPRLRVFRCDPSSHESGIGFEIQSEHGSNTKLPEFTFRETSSEGLGIARITLFRAQIGRA